MLKATLERVGTPLAEPDRMLTDTTPDTTMIPNPARVIARTHLATTSIMPPSSAVYSCCGCSLAGNPVVM